MEESVKLVKIIDLIEQFGGTDGGHHKQWVIDQIIRIAVDNYDQWVSEYCKGKDGPDTYYWDIGIAP